MPARKTDSWCMSNDFGLVHSSMPSFEGNLLTQRHEICSQETRDSRLSYGENPESLSHLGLKSVPGRDRRTDGQNYDS